jgi:Tol biopolymer transport system component/class 3 adenylate cyclase
MAEDSIQIHEHRLSVIMFSDIVGYSKMMQSDEKLTMDLLSRHDAIIRESLKQYDGTEIKVIGDAFLVSFSTVTNAVQCAIEIQEKFTKYNEEQNERERIQVRIGIHLGDIVIKENDVFGDGVNIASRIEPLAEPGGICISQEIYNLVKHKLDLQVVSLGPKELKNIKDKIEIYQILVGSIAGKKWRRSGFRSKIRKWQYSVPIFAVIIFLISIISYLQLQKQPAQILTRALKVRTMEIYSASISSDGNWIVFAARFADGFPNIYVIHTSGGEPRKVTTDSTSFPKINPCFSPDGSKIAYESFDIAHFVDNIYIVPTLGGKPQKFIDSAYLPDWSPDGRFLSFYKYEGSNAILWMYEFANEQMIKITDTKITSICTDWSPDSKKIAFLKASQSKKDCTAIFIHDLATGGKRQLIDEAKIAPNFCWTTNDDLIFNSTRGGTENLWMIPVNEGTPRQLTLGNGNDGCPSISKDGKRLVYINNSMTRNIWKAELEKSKISQLTFEEGICGQPSFSPDGNKIAFLFGNGFFKSGNLELIVCDKDGSEPNNFPLGNDKVARGWDPLEWSVDGNQLAFSIEKVDTIEAEPDSIIHTPTIMLFDIPTKKLKKIGEGWLCSWSSDGKYILYTSAKNDEITLLDSIVAFGKTIRKINGAARLPLFPPSISLDCKNIFYQNKSGLWSMKILNGSTKLLSKNMFVGLHETPDKKAFIFTDHNSKNNSYTIKKLSKSDNKTTNLFELPSGAVSPAILAPDMKTILFTKNQVYNKIMVMDNIY